METGKKGKSPLAQKKENFAAFFVETGNASEAYRRAFKPKDWKPESVTNAASAMMKDPYVAARVHEMRNSVATKAKLTLEQHLDRLNELSYAAQDAGQFGPAVTAEHHRGRACGFYTERIDHTSGGQALGVVVLPMKNWGGTAKAEADEEADD